MECRVPTMEWNEFAFDWSLNPDNLRSALVEIEAHKLSVLGLVVPPVWRGQLDRLNRIRAVHGTTALEGNPLSEAEVSHQIDAAESATATREQQQIRNAGRAQEWIKSRFPPSSALITIPDILLMHNMITERADLHHNFPGQFRTFSVVVGTPELGGVHRGAPQQDISQLMEEYVHFINSQRMRDTHPVIRALLAHFFLVTIHPFGDGNGRVSRLVEAGILFQGVGATFLGFMGSRITSTEIAPNIRKRYRDVGRSSHLMLLPSSSLG